MNKVYLARKNFQEEVLKDLKLFEVLSSEDLISIILSSSLFDEKDKSQEVLTYDFRIKSINALFFMIKKYFYGRKLSREETEKYFKEVIIESMLLRNVILGLYPMSDNDYNDLYNRVITEFVDFILADFLEPLEEHHYEDLQKRFSQLKLTIRTLTLDHYDASDFDEIFSIVVSRLEKSHNFKHLTNYILEKTGRVVPSYLEKLIQTKKES